MASDTSDKYCILGAGACGLTALKNLLQQGIAADCLEKETAIGGIWNLASGHSPVYATTQLISSKKLTSYVDFPMPDDYPPYPGQAQALDYLNAYARHFGLHDHISLGKTIKSVKEGGGGWMVQVEGEASPRPYKGVIVANGHFTVPNRPDYPGSFSGEEIHSLDYVEPDQLKGKRLLVVGTGNSGCDIVCDAVGQAEAIFHSMKHGFYVFPKFFRGKPMDLAAETLQHWPLPGWLRNRIYERLYDFYMGRMERYGLPKPPGALLDGRATIAPHYLHHLGHGRFIPKPGIERLAGNTVRFTDGTEEEIDLIAYATGYKVTIPFMDENLLLTPEGRSRLFLHIFHPEKDTLFAVGLVDLNGGFWRIADYQAQLIAAFIAACESGADTAKRLRKLKAGRKPGDSGTGRLSGVDRNRKLFVDYYEYRRDLKHMLARMGTLE